MKTNVHSTDAAARRHRHVAALALAAVSLLLCSAYALANQLTRGRTDVGTAVFAWERSIPFVDWTIVPYLSIVLFFAGAFFLCRDRAQLRLLVLRVLMVLAVSLACFALWPLRFTFERPPTAGVIGALFDLLHYVDLPYNRAPSLHVSMVVILWALFAERLRGALRLAVGLWFGLIAVSVLTTYQHHVIDVPAGLLAGWFCVWLFPSPRRGALTARIAAQPASWQGARAPRASAS